MEAKDSSLIKYYEDTCDESNRIDNERSLEFLTTMKYLKAVCRENAKILDASAGCGVYAFPLAELGYKVTAGDLVEHNVKQIQARQLESPILEDIYCGSILDLSRFEDESFDVVLNFGAYYHLPNGLERNNAINECLRVLKKEGIFALAFLNKYSNFFKYNNQWKDDFARFEEYFEKGFNEDDTIFYADSPEEVETCMMKHGLNQLHIVATDGLKFAIRNSLQNLDDATFKKYLKLHYKMCEVTSLLGYSEHGLYIGRK